MVIDEQPVTPCLSNIDFPQLAANGLIRWHGGRCCYRAGTKSAIFNCLVYFWQTVFSCFLVTAGENLPICVTVKSQTCTVIHTQFLPHDVVYAIVVCLSVLLILNYFSRPKAVRCTVDVVISLKRCKVETLLLQNINRKWSITHGMAAVYITLSDLQGYSRW